MWLFTTVGFLGAFLFILAQAPWFMFPPRHAELPPGALAWVFLASVIVFIGATYGTWAGSRYGRNLFLSFLAIIAAIIVYALASETLAMLRSGWQDWMRGASRDAVGLSSIWILWAAINGWYFSRKRTRLFFDQRSAAHPWFAASGMMVVALGAPALVFGGIETAYQTLGAERSPPSMLAEQLRISPGSELGQQEEREQFLQFRENDGANSWEAEESRKFSALLQKRFPPPTTEGALTVALRAEGFYAPPLDSYSDGDGGKMLAYEWWRFDGLRRDDCLEDVHVHWSTSSQGEVDGLRGEYHKICGFLLEPQQWLW